MSALESIIDWVDESVDLDCGQTVEQNFADINEMFTGEHRLDLESILKDQLPDFMIFLALKQESECEDADEIIENELLEQRVDVALKQADILLKRFDLSKGAI